MRRVGRIERLRAPFVDGSQTRVRDHADEEDGEKRRGQEQQQQRRDERQAAFGLEQFGKVTFHHSGLTYNDRRTPSNAG